MRIPIYAPYLTLIASGRKTMEGRLCTNLWTRMEPGQIVTFFDGQQRTATVRIREVFQHSSFEDMLSTHGISAFLPDKADDDMEGAVSLYRSFPGYAARERQLGACGMRFEVLEETAKAKMSSDNKKLKDGKKRRNYHPYRKEAMQK